MIQRLRKRFVLISMLAIVIVLAIIMGAINLLNYRSVTRGADTVIDILEEHGDASMRPGGPGGPGEPAPPSTKGKWRGASAVSVETPYESRYFTVLLDEEGDVSSYDIAHIAAIDEDTAGVYASEARTKREDSGFIDNFRYHRYDTEDGTKIMFLDCTRSISNFRDFLFASLLVSALALAGVLLLVIVLSGRAVRPVQESYEKQKRFITDAGHELKTPLTIIDADISVAEMEGAGSEWLDDVKVQTARLAGLTNDLIYLSRMDEGASQLRMIDFPVSDLVQDAVRSFQARSQLEGKTLSADIEPMLTLHGDEKSVEKLISILLDNALKYSAANGRIFVSLTKKARNIVLAVENDADNIEPDQLRHLFERFYRSDASRNSKTGGHGIGLSIALAVMEAHRGTIEASSPDGGTLRITASFPAP